VVAACITPPVGPDYKRPAVPLPTEWRTDPNEAADVVNTPWWTAFNDPDLNALINQALAANLDVLAAAARVDEFEGKLERSTAHRYPDIGYEANATRYERSLEVPEELTPGQPHIYNKYQFGATLSFEFDFWGRVRRANEAARAELLSSKEARHTVMLTVVSAVAATYVQLLVMDRELALAQETLASYESSLALAEDKFHGGSATEITVERIRADLQEEQALIPELERNISTLENELSILIGSNPAPVRRGHIDALVLPPVPAGIPSDVLVRRPDVLVAEENLVAANARIGVAKADYFPSLTLTSVLGQSSDLTQYLLASTAHFGQTTGLLVGPLLSFGRVEGHVREVRAEAQENVDRYLQTAQVALQEVNDALVANVKSKARLAALDQRVQTLKQLEQLWRKRYVGGQSTYLDVLDADRNVIGGETDQARGVRDEYLTLIAVYKAMGGGWMVEHDKDVGFKVPKRAPPPAPSGADMPLSVSDGNAK
jgi:outer membrane protein, multidrug efflux system